MMQQKKTKKPIKPVKKPFLRGSIVDKGTAKSAFGLLMGILMMALANILLSSLLMWDAHWVSVMFNGMLLLVIYAMFAQSGASKGTIAVNQGEIMYQRQEAGRPVNQADLAMCYHPMKGFVTGLIGSVPVIICALILAAIAQRQYTSLGALPSWIGTLQRRPEVGEALAFYNEVAPLTLEDIMRVIVRMLLMPYVNMLGVENRDGLLMLERISVLPMLLPGLSYGLGYMQGVKERSRVHTDIAVGKRKRARKERKQRQARVTKGPEQLN